MERSRLQQYNAIILVFYSATDCGRCTRVGQTFTVRCGGAEFKISLEAYIMYVYYIMVANYNELF